MRLILLCILLPTACSGASSEVDARSGTLDRTIMAQGRAIDGDTVSFDVRLFGADAFERRQLCSTETGCWQCGKAAQDYMARLLKSGEATIVLTGKQSYGRPVGTVTVHGQDLGEAMIEAGLGVPATQYLAADPDRASRYVAAYHRAVSAHMGAHAGSFIHPAKWRRGQRLACENNSRNDRADRAR